MALCPYCYGTQLSQSFIRYSSDQLKFWEQIHIDNAIAETWVATNHYYYLAAFPSYILFYSIPTTIININQSTNSFWKKMGQSQLLLIPS